jgi:hypothetical protein
LITPRADLPDKRSESCACLLCENCPSCHSAAGTRYCSFPQIRSIFRAVPPRQEGRIAIVTNAKRDAMDADASSDVRCGWRTAKACGPGTPGLVPSLQVMILQATVTKRSWTPGRARSSVNTIAQGMSDCFGVPVVNLLVCFLLLHARPRVHKTPGIPCALFLSRDKVDAQLGRMTPRECRFLSSAL